MKPASSSVPGPSPLTRSAKPPTRRGACAAASRQVLKTHPPRRRSLRGSATAVAGHAVCWRTRPAAPLGDQTPPVPPLPCQRSLAFPWPPMAAMPAAAGTPLHCMAGRASARRSRRDGARLMGFAGGVSRLPRRYRARVGVGAGELPRGAFLILTPCSCPARGTPRHHNATSSVPAAHAGKGLRGLRSARPRAGTRARIEGRANISCSAPASGPGRDAALPGRAPNPAQQAFNKEFFIRQRCSIRARMKLEGDSRSVRAGRPLPLLS